MTSFARLWARAALFTALSLAWAVTAQAQDRGAVTGQVTDASTKLPIASAQVFVRGTALGGFTNSNGRYRIQNVPAGAQEVRVTTIGYAGASRTVQVAAGETATADFALSPTAVELGAVVVSATGQKESKREVGNAISTIKVDEVPLGAVNSLQGLLQGRSAGVSVLSAGGTSGTGSRIRIRGSNSVSLSNDPLLIIDGIRADVSTSSSIGVGGQNPDRFNDIPPEEIESIDILKGPAASALYGTAAANGVIVVTTKKGKAGQTRFNFYTEQTQLKNYADFPANWLALTPDGADACYLVDQATGDCSLGNLESFNPLTDPRSTPFETGNRQKYGINVTGGNDITTYFIAGELEKENGVYKYDLNGIDRSSLRANLRSALRDNFDVTVSTGYVNSRLRLPQNDNDVLGIVSGALLGFPEFDSESEGYGFGLTPQDISAILTLQQLERFTGSLSGNYRPFSWFEVVATAGVDRANRHDNETIPPERVNFSSLPEGERSSNRAEITDYTANLSGTATYDVSGDIGGSTSVGGQFTDEVFRQTTAFGAKLLAGTSSLNGVNARFNVGENNSDVRTIGVFAQQKFSYKDRLYVSGALRADDNSAFGADFGLIAYPAAELSWVIGDEPWFPKTSALSSLRLRTAWGRSGLRPGFRDAIQYLNPVAVVVSGQEVPGFTFGGAGNINLRPEKSTEYEAGLDAGFANERLGLELTYYHKTSVDALISRRLPPSLGVSSSRFENLGSVLNEGLELLLNARLLQMSSLQWDATLTGSWTKNELTDIGTDPTTGDKIAPIIFGLGGDTQHHQEGFPLGGYWAVPITGYSDADGNGLLSPDEVQVGDEPTYLGPSFPTREFSLQTSATFKNVVNLSALVDYHGGYKQFNSTEEFRCGAFQICRADFDPSASLADQAAAIGTLIYGTPAGYIENADFAKFRELSVALIAPRSFAQQMGFQGLKLTLSGHNLAVWTNYKGLDPEINFAGTSSNFTTAEFLTQPPTRFYTLRVDLNF